MVENARTRRFAVAKKRADTHRGNVASAVVPRNKPGSVGKSRGNSSRIGIPFDYSASGSRWQTLRHINILEIQNRHSKKGNIDRLLGPAVLCSACIEISERRLSKPSSSFSVSLPFVINCVER